MFQVNDVIIYGVEGVFRIAEIVEKTISGVTRKYFVLKPVRDGGTTIFAPTDNEFVLKKMRRLLSKAEIDGLIDSMPNEAEIWVANQNERKELFKGILERGNHLELIQMIKSIYVQKKAREAGGKRLHISDEHFFRDAEQVLYNEFQYVLKLNTKEELMAYILNRIANPESSHGA